MARLTLNVNGRDHTIEAPPDMPLLWAIRDLIGLTGTKYGCGLALCGACKIHIDGTPAYSCQTPVSSVGERQVTTIEGPSRDCHRMSFIRSSRHGLPRTSRNAATANLGKS